MRSPLDGGRAEAFGVDRARDHGDALGRDLVALDHGARDVGRGRDHPVAAGERGAEGVADEGMRRQPVGKRGDQINRLLPAGGAERAPGRGGAVGMDDVDALAGDQVADLAGVAGNAQRIEAVGGHRQPFAAEGAQFADQRAAVAGDQRAGAGLQQRERDIGHRMAGGIVRQGRHQLQDGGAGERARAGPPGGDRGGSGRALRPLAFRARLRREGAAAAVHAGRHRQFARSPDEQIPPHVPGCRITPTCTDHRRARARGQES